MEITLWTRHTFHSFVIRIGGNCKDCENVVGCTDLYHLTQLYELITDPNAGLVYQPSTRSGHIVIYNGSHVVMN